MSPGQSKHEQSAGELRIGNIQLSSQPSRPSTRTRNALAALDLDRSRQAGTPEWRRLSREFAANRGGLIGALIVLCLVTAALTAPFIAPHSPDAQDLLAALEAPSLTHPMGTDEFGRDIFSRILYGASISLRIGMLAVLFSAVVGVSVGLASGYFGGVLDSVSMRLVDTLLAFPDILLALVVLAILGPSLTSVILAVAVAQIPIFIRLVRASTLSEREHDYVVAIRVLGASDARIIVRHLMPNIVAPFIVLASVTMGSAILVGSGLSFLGLGARPPTPEWGAMLISSRLYMHNAPWIALFPGLAILLTVFAFNMVGDGLRDATDVRLRKR
jgi:peptide/nickel transport system permease protein